MPGYRCLPIADDRTEKGPNPNTGTATVCLRDCTLSDPQPKTDALCNYDTRMWLSDDQAGETGYNIAQDTKCLNVAGFDACVKDVAFEPR
jgi:hypothetical protein